MEKINKILLVIAAIGLVAIGMVIGYVLMKPLVNNMSNDSLTEPNYSQNYIDDDYNEMSDSYFADGMQMTESEEEAAESKYENTYNSDGTIKMSDSYNQNGEQLSQAEEDYAEDHGEPLYSADGQLKYD